MHPYRFLFRIVPERHAGVLPLVALILLPLGMMMALGVDYANMVDARAAVAAAADASSFAGLQVATQEYVTQPQTWSDTDAVATIKQRFNSQVSQMQSVIVNPLTNVSVTRDPGTTKFTATFDYSGNYQSSFGFWSTNFGATSGQSGSSSGAGCGGVAGNMCFAGTTGATTTTGSYVEVDILLDTSSSMLIGSTTQDINALKKITYKELQSPFGPGPQTESNCGLACHDTLEQTALDTYSLIQAGNFLNVGGSGLNNGISLRLDQLKGAIGSIVTGIQNKDPNSLIDQHYTVALYQFNDVNAFHGQTAVPTLTQVVAPSADMAAVAAAVPGIQPAVAGRGIGNTHLTIALQNFQQNYLGVSGDGSNPSQRIKYVVLMTDGIDDTPNGKGGRNLVAVDPNACSSITGSFSNATLIVIHTVFNEAADFQNEIANVEAQVEANLKQCATTTAGVPLYESVASQAELDNAVQAVLSAAGSQFTKFSQ